MKMPQLSLESPLTEQAQKFNELVEIAKQLAPPSPQVVLEGELTMSCTMKNQDMGGLGRLFINKKHVLFLSKTHEILTIPLEDVLKTSTNYVLFSHELMLKTPAGQLLLTSSFPFDEIVARIQEYKELAEQPGEEPVQQEYFSAEEIAQIETRRVQAPDELPELIYENVFKNVQLSDYFDVILADREEKPTGYDSFTSKVMTETGNFEVVTSSWEPPVPDFRWLLLHEEVPTRTSKYKTRLPKMPFMPEMGITNETHFLYGLGQHKLKLHSRILMKDVPYADIIQIQVLYELTQENQALRYRVSGLVELSQNIFIKNILISESYSKMRGGSPQVTDLYIRCFRANRKKRSTIVGAPPEEEE
jgi:hypothetical protein